MQPLFQSRSLSVESFDGAWLAGVLELPEKFHTIAITVHGSFAQTRDGNVDSARTWMFPEPVPARNLFIDFRDVALPMGVGTYRYDKRASGASEGIWAETDFHTIAKDLLAVFNELYRRFPQTQLMFVGQSEGCLTSLKAIEMGAKPDFFISQGGALEPYLSLIDRQKDKAGKLFLEDTTGKLEAANPMISLFYKEYFRGNFRNEIESGSAKHYVLKNDQFQCKMNVDLFRQYDQFDPQDVLRNFPGRSLLMNGTEDLNVPPSAVIEIAKRKEQGDFPRVTCALLPGLEHSFRRCLPNETFIEVAKKPIDPQYAETVRVFLKTVHR